MDGVDLLITPTLICVAPPAGIGDLALRDRLIRLTYPFNLVGAPALALPCGAAEDGLPASVQLVGRPGEDAFVLAAGRAIEDGARSALSQPSRESVPSTRAPALAALSASSSSPSSAPWSVTRTPAASLPRSTS